MKLIIVFFNYTAIVLLSLFLLYGPLRRALDPKRKKPALTIIIMILVTAAFTLPAIGAILPDGERCYFFQHPVIHGSVYQPALPTQTQETQKPKLEAV